MEREGVVLFCVGNEACGPDVSASDKYASFDLDGDPLLGPCEIHTPFSRRMELELTLAPFEQLVTLQRFLQLLLGETFL